MKVSYYQFKKYFKGKKVIFILHITGDPKNIECSDFTHIPEISELRYSPIKDLGEVRIQNIQENDFEIVNII